MSLEDPSRIEQIHQEVLAEVMEEPRLMANTADLIGLQLEYIGAFADPEAAPPELASTDSGLGRVIASNPKTMSPDQVRDFAEEHLQATQAESDEWVDSGMADAQLFMYYIGRICHDPQLTAIALDFLQKITEVQDIDGLVSHYVARQFRPNDPPTIIKGNVTSIKERPGIVLDLPETHARQSSAECASGMCDL